MTYKKGDRVQVTYRDSHYRDQFGTVIEDQTNNRVNVKMDSGAETRWMESSLTLIAAASSVQPFNLNAKQIAVLEAATELREAQLKFQKALDALNETR